MASSAPAICMARTAAPISSSACSSRPAGASLTASRARAVEAHGIERIAADAVAVGDAGLRRLDERHGRAAAVAARQHGQVLGVLGEGHGAQRAR